MCAAILLHFQYWPYLGQSVQELMGFFSNFTEQLRSSWIMIKINLVWWDNYCWKGWSNPVLQHHNIQITSRAVVAKILVSNIYQTLLWNHNSYYYNIYDIQGTKTNTNLPLMLYVNLSLVRKLLSWFPMNFLGANKQKVWGLFPSLVTLMCSCTGECSTGSRFLSPATW